MTEVNVTVEGAAYLQPGAPLIEGTFTGDAELSDDGVQLSVDLLDGTVEIPDMEPISLSWTDAVIKAESPFVNGETVEGFAYGTLSVYQAIVAVVATDLSNVPEDPDAAAAWIQAELAEFAEVFPGVEPMGLFVIQFNVTGLPEPEPIRGAVIRPCPIGLMHEGLSDLPTQEQVEAQIASALRTKQNKLTAGRGISLINDVISLAKPPISEDEFNTHNASFFFEICTNEYEETQTFYVSKEALAVKVSGGFRLADQTLKTCSVTFFVPAGQALLNYPFSAVSYDADNKLLEMVSGTIDLQPDPEAPRNPGTFTVSGLRKDTFSFANVSPYALTWAESIWFNETTLDYRDYSGSKGGQYSESSGGHVLSAGDADATNRNGTITVTLKGLMPDDTF